ncbi:MAG: aquaporin [Verrucomicrobiaceae bacterium]|nr:aquaporin [Verrucomicrobiaceae bacterium]
MKKYISEIIGTFFLVYTVCCTVSTNQPLAAISIGLALAVMVYAGGHLSGAHYNPAVTVAVLLRGKIGLTDAIIYIFCQTVAGVVAAMVAKTLVGAGTDPKPFPIDNLMLAEAIGTFALAWVVLNVATTKANNNNSFYGAAIGLTVTSGAVAVGGVSGAAFNPAVATGAVAMGLLNGGQLWAYWVFCILGGAVAAIVFKAIKADD